MTDTVRARCSGRSLHTPSRTTRELPSCLKRTADDRGDLLERYIEGIMQHERNTFRRRERLEHDEQRETDGVRQLHVVLQISRVGDRDRLRSRRVQLLLSPSLSRAQHVETDTR